MTPFVDRLEDTVEVCLAWAGHRRVFVEAIGDGDLSRPALVEAMVRGGPEVWEAVTSFCEVSDPSEGGGEAQA